MRILPCACLLGLLLSACSSEKSTTVTNSDGEQATLTTDSDDSGGSFKVENESGSATVTTGDKASANLPFGLPVYPGAKVVMNVSGNSGAGQGSMVSAETGATPAEVVAFYKKFAKDNGFDVEGEATVNDMVTFGAKRGKDSFQISAQPGSGNQQGKTVVMVMAGMGG